METNSSLSDYEKVRLKNIERNLAFLSSIGLSGSYSLISTNKPERSTKTSKDPPIVPAVVEPSRRSSRIAALENVTGVDNINSQSTYDTGSSSFKRRKGNNPFGFEKVDINLNSPHRFLSCLSAAGSQPSSSSASKDPQSTRNISANYSQFISPMTLGKPHHTFGKASVLTHSNDGITPKFSKYSGILEWTNCVYLWVNLGGQSADGGYDNTFLDEGRSFVWFGGSKMTKESPITQRLLRAGISQGTSSSNPLSTEDDREQHPINGSNTIPVDDAAPTTGQVENISDTSDDVVLLFVRIVGKPYTCLGSLSVLNCNFDMHPLVIHWRLNEYDQLMNGIGSGEFQRILNASPWS